MALRNLLVRVGADITGLQRNMSKANKSLNNFRKSVDKSMGSVQASIAKSIAAIGGGLFVHQGIEDAIKYEALMTTLGQTMGKSLEKFIEWQKETGSALGFSKLQGAELANMLSLNFKEIATSTEDLMLKTTKMMEVAAVIANKRGMAMTEVSDRIRSAMNQEADGAQELGVNVRISAIKMSEAYKQMANGQPWDQLSNYQQKTILYHHILEQVSKNLGDQLGVNTQIKLAAFTASLNDTKMALGQAFLPILNIVLPVLTAFMRKIESALGHLYAFTRTLFGMKGGAKALKTNTSATEKQTDAVVNLGNATADMGDKAEKAGKQAKKGVLGFDEVHQLADAVGNASVGGGGGGVGGGGGAIPIPEMPVMSDDEKGFFDMYADKVSELGKKMRKFFQESNGFHQFVDGLKIFWQSLKDFWESDAIKNFRKNFAEDLPDFFSDLALIGGGVFQTLGGAIKIVTGLLNQDLAKGIEGIGDVIGGMWEMLSGVIGLILPELGNAMDKFGKKFSEKWKWFYDTFVKDSESIEEIANKLGIFISTKIVEYIDEMKKKANEKINNMINDAVKSFNNFSENSKWIFQILKDYIVGKADEQWKDFIKPWKDASGWFTRNVTDPIKNAFGGISSSFNVSVTEGFKSMYNKAIGWINGMISDLNGLNIPGISIKKIPKLAKGGITNGPTLAMVGDNVGGQEVISPLDKLQGYIATAVSSALAVTNNNTDNTDIVLNIDGRTLARIVRPHLEKEFKRLGTNVRFNPI